MGGSESCGGCAVGSVCGRWSRTVDANVREWCEAGDPDGVLRRAAEKRNRRSRGLGDTVRKIADATGISAAAKLYERVTGKDCGCKQRQESLNRLVPYSRPDEPPAPSP
jgi:hypothetical protein